jgi:nitric oxide reductase NorD protein
MHSKYYSFTAEQLQEILNDFLGLVWSESRSLIIPVQALARCSRQQQDWVLAWLRILVRNHSEIAYPFVQSAPQALALLETNLLEEWLAETLEIYEHQDPNAAIAHLQAVATYTQVYQRRQHSLPLAEIQGVLEKLVLGLAGRQLQLASSEITYTDTATLFLPPVLNRFVERQNNFYLYKAMVVHLWAQIEFGTWQHRLSTITAQFNHRDKAIRLFHTLERLRLDASVARELPGCHRDMGHLLTLFSEQRIPCGWETIAQQLAQPSASVEDSYRLLTTVYSGSVPAPVCYQGVLLPEATEPTIELRAKPAWQATTPQLNPSSDSLTDLTPAAASNSMQIDATKMPTSLPTAIVNHSTVTTDLLPASMTPPAEVDIQSITHSTNDESRFTAELKCFSSSTTQANDKIPEDYLFISGNDTGESTTINQTSNHSYGNQTNTTEKTFIYPEWDYRRQKYYHNWCTLREVEVPPQATDEFVTTTLQRYRGLLKPLRRIFAVLRGGDKRLKKQYFGEDIDLDALITAYADARNGLEMDEQIFTKLQRVTRDVAVMLMIDMSGSTKGWINQAERESLILLGEVLETLGDRYAIYGFSGKTRKHCEIYPIKRFDEAYHTGVRQRISGIAPQQYTRMGVTIRHLTQLLKPIEARIKLLITLSDGKPDDEGDNYRGIYGIEDTRQALFEAKREGIHPFCITIDTEARIYLPRLYGTVNYIVIDKVQQLPLKIADIYRKLTT